MKPKKKRVVKKVKKLFPKKEIRKLTKRERERERESKIRNRPTELLG
jgi:hypothetical protein